MSTKNAVRNQAGESGDEEADLFTAVEPVETVDDVTLQTMRKPEQLAEDGTAVFAVGSRVGVLRSPDESSEYEATAVLYLTADGRHAVERFFPRGLDAAPRACRLPSEKLHQAQPDGSPHAMAELLDAHPEVDR